MTVLPAEVAPGETVEVKVELDPAGRVQGPLKAGLRGHAVTTHVSGYTVTNSTEALHEEIRHLPPEASTHRLQFTVPSNAEESGPSSKSREVAWIGWVSGPGRFGGGRRELAQLVTVSIPGSDSPQAQARGKEGRRKHTRNELVVAFFALVVLLGAIAGGVVLDLSGTLMSVLGLIAGGTLVVALNRDD